jgi:hypothetical protein
MSADNDLRDAMIEELEPILLGPSAFLNAATGRDEHPARAADAILALLARWQCNEPSNLT